MCAKTQPFQSTGRAFCDRMKTKTIFFHYLAESMTALQLPGVEIITTSGADVLFSSRDGRSYLLQPRGGGYEDLHSCEARISQGSQKGLYQDG